MRFDYVTVGHVTVDVLEEPSASAGRRQPGGGAFYSALQAARLGLRTLIITRGARHELQALLEPYRGELQIEIEAAAQTTTLYTQGHGHDRRQRLLAWAGPFVEPIAVDTAILHLAPIARETPRSWDGCAEFVGLTPQGLVRAWNASGDVTRVALEPGQLPTRWDAAVLSTGERDSCGELIRSAYAEPTPREFAEPTPEAPAESAPGASPQPTRGVSAGGPLVAVTAGALPTTILQAGGPAFAVPPPVNVLPRDDLGAGDVFAAAFFVAFHEGLTPAAAAAYGNAAAAVRIAGVGPDAIGDRRAIAARL